MNGPTPRLARGLVTAALSSALLAAAVGTALPATADPDAGEEARRKPTLIQVKVNDRGPRVRPTLLGINHRYGRNGFGLWDEAKDEPNPNVVDKMAAAGVASLRFPGGTTATMYHWKDAVGPGKRGCQIEGHGHHVKDGFEAFRHGLAYGPDEFMEVIAETGATPLIMMPFVTQTPGDAADWVEYMNDPVGGRNPRGGIVWATERAENNGDPAPYDVRRWEVGNESHVAPGRFGFSSKPDKAVQQYIRGGVRSIEREELGKRCAHPTEGIPSNGKPNQRFEVLFTPAKIRHVSVNGVRWTKVADLAAAGPRARVYEVKPGGVVAFGDDSHGAIPKADAVVRATYRNDYSGFFAFAREMHEVDKSINVCASWGTPLFSNSTRGRRFDCQTAHPITNFSREYGHNWRRPWNGPLEGHDRMMMGLDDRYGDVREMLEATPRRSPVWLTEFQPIHGHDEDFPTWSTSLSNAVYMASQWSSWLRLGISWGSGGDLLAPHPGAVFGTPPQPTFSVEAEVRKAIRPMFYEANRVVTSAISRNPTRVPDLRPRDSYKAVSAVAARGPGGRLWVHVVNRLPLDKVRAKVELRGMKAKRNAVVRRVAGDNFREANLPGEPPNVAMDEWTRVVNARGFKATLPPHSVTVFRVILR